MHRLRSPLVALLAILIAAGPLAGRISQTSPADPYQISTPSAWERSRQETIPVAEPALRFSHDGITDESDLQRRYSIGDDVLLASPTKVAYLEVSTMSVLWELEPNFEIVRVSLLEGTNPPNIMVSGETTCTLLDTQERKVRWERPDCPSGSFNLRDDGLIVHTFGSDGESTMRALDATTGEERWSYSYAPNPDVRSYRNSPERGIVYFFTTSSVDAVSMDTGDVLWTTPVVAEVGVILLESHLLLLQKEEIIALDPASGGEIWLAFMEPGYYTSSDHAQPLTGEKLLVSVGTSIAILDVTTGLELARYEDAQVNVVYYQDEAGETIHPGVFNLRVGNDSVGIDWETLEEAWKVSNTGGLATYGWAYNDVQLTMTNDDRMVLIDIRTGRTLATVETTDYTSTNDGDTLLFRYEQRIEAYDTISKRRQWTYTPPNELRRSNSSNDHVVVTTPYNVYLLDAQTGEVVKETTHPDYWESYRLSSQFIFYWDGSSVTAVHHLTGTKTTFEGVYDFDDLSYARTGVVWYVTYPSGMQTLDAKTGRSLFTTGTPIDYHTNAGEIALLTSAGEHDTFQFVEPSGDVRWELDVPAGFIEVTYYSDENKILLQGRTQALLLNAETGDIIMDIPVAYNPDGGNDSLYISTAEAILVGSDAESVIYQVPAPTVEQLVKETTVRGGPSPAGVERGTFPAGTPVFPTGNVRERSDGIWIEVRVEDVTGWVHEDSLTGNATAPVATPLATP